MIPDFVEKQKPQKIREPKAGRFWNIRHKAGAPKMAVYLGTSRSTFNAYFQMPSPCINLTFNGKFTFKLDFLMVASKCLRHPSSFQKLIVDSYD